LCIAGVVTLGLDSIAKTFDPKAKDHDTFQLVAATTSGSAIVKQDTISGALIDLPPITLDDLSVLRRA